MAKNITNVQISDTFQVWLSKTNELVDLVNSDILTASQSGDTTIGNTTLSGNFAANNITVTGTTESNIIQAKTIALHSTSSLGYIDVTAQTRFSYGEQKAVIIKNSVGPRIAVENNSASWVYGLLDDTPATKFIISTDGFVTPAMSLTSSGDLSILNNISAQSLTVNSISAPTIVGNASTASKLQNSFDITSIGGDITLSIAGIDGSSNVIGSATLNINVVENTNIRKSAALSIIGRSANSLGNVADITASSDHQVLRRSGAALGFGAIALNQSNAVTGILSVANGGTGKATIASGQIIFGNGTSAVGTSSNMVWDNTNGRMGIKKVAPAYEIDVVGDIQASGLFRGTATSAQYADLAEKYLADEDYEVGTVVCVGGEKEITATQTDDLPIGVISGNPAFRMNEGLEGGIYVALKGRVPVKVIGKVEKGDKLVPSFMKGYAEVASSNSLYNIFAVALKNDENGVVEAIIL